MIVCRVTGISQLLTRARAATCAAAALAVLVLAGASAHAGDAYHYYFGNTHSHTSYSDGGTSTPSDHFSLAKSAGFDFYAVTDHALAKYPNFTPQSYEDTKRQADIFTDSTFVGIAGFEYSENDGAGGKGHLNALNTAGYLDATGTSTNLPLFYDWLVNNQTTTVAASFNHPGATQYNSFDYFSSARRNAITMYEMINSGSLHYDGFIAALNKGWRVAPIAGQDGHGTWRVTNHAYRTGVLATSLTRESLMQAMRARRVYCTWDKNLRVMFSANGYVMGSVIASPPSLSFRVSVYDPDTGNPSDRISRIEIVGENGTVVSSKSFSAHTATLSTTASPSHRYYFARVCAADKTDGPTAYSAPIWIENSTAPSIPDAKAAADGAAVYISGASVSAAWPGFFYVESDERHSGIRVDRESHGLEAGKRADVIGTVQTDPSTERYIRASEVRFAGTGSVEPLYLVNRDLGGEPAGIGLGNTGLLVRVSGRVQYVDPNREFAYIDDGSGCHDGNSLGKNGVRVITSGLELPAAGSHAVVTGVSTITTVGDEHVRAVRMVSDDVIRVSGNRLLRDGKPFVPLGFTMVGLLSPTQTGTAGVAGQHYGQTELDAAKAWGANTLRFQISQRGFDPIDSLHSSAYVQRVKDGVALARRNGFAVILSMQDQSYSGGDATGMPEPQTLRSWGEVARHFNSDLGIVYELFNEPMIKDSAAEWVVWRDGGTYDGQVAVGHQQLVDRVRASGSRNVLIVEGARVGKSFIGYPGLNDPLGQLAFGVHPYLTWPIKETASWDRYFGDFAETHPVIATEWSAVSWSSFCQPEWPSLSPLLLDYLKSRGIGLMPWAFDILDTLIKDWSWTPTTFDGFSCGVRGPGPGKLVKDYFTSYHTSP